jgi:MOSC domain-containing protein YiiM
MMTGRVIGVYRGARRGAAKKAIAQAELVAGHGMRGDAHAGAADGREVSLFAGEVLRALADEGFKLSAEDLSANLLTEGIDLDALEAGAQLRVGAAWLEIVAPRRPCRSLTRLDHRLPRRLRRECGLLARVVRGGMVEAGEQVELIKSAG